MPRTPHALLDAPESVKIINEPLKDKALKPSKLKFMLEMGRGLTEYLWGELDTSGRNLLAQTLGLPGDIGEAVRFLEPREGSSGAPTSDELIERFGGDAEHWSYWPTALAAPGPGEVGTMGKALLKGGGDVGALLAQTLFHGTPHKFDKGEEVFEAASERVMPQVEVSGRRQYEAFTEPVHVDDLLEMQGNRLGKTDLEKLKTEIKEAGGLQEPVIIQVGKQDRSTIVGEGNHRVRAAKELGYDYVPARVIVQRETHGTFKNYWPDITPKADEYFKSDARPSEVFRNVRVKRDGEVVFEK